jgi:hypothetical protein
MNKVALLVLYNHRYDKNIVRIENIYKERFSNVFHLMPFYDGNRKNVIPVYESSYHFQGYISQAYHFLKNKGFTHYFVVADDMILNPIITENNLHDIIGISDGDCYIDSLLSLQDKKSHWSRIYDAMDYSPCKKKGVEISNILPNIELAKKRLLLYGNISSRISLRFFYNVCCHGILCEKLKVFYKFFIYCNKRTLDYPLVGGYSDILLLTADIMGRFVLYSGAFAATDLFVELAIPTALVLSSDNIKTNADIYLNSGALWTKEDFKILNKYEFNLQRLMYDFPQNKLYIHPIKLSKWK